MNIDDIFLQRRKRWNSLLQIRKNPPEEMKECPVCHKKIEKALLRGNFGVCTECGYYFPLSPRRRLELVCDAGSFKELDGKLSTGNPLDFPEYEQKLAQNQMKTGQTEAIVNGVGSIQNHRVAIGIMDGRFFMGSMGTVVGEKVARLCEYAGKKKLPLVLFCASGGARMQEGLFSLMQMAKTGAAVERYRQNGGLFLSVLTNPTTGGVSASFANLGDIILAEPKALICFAGPRVIEQTIGQKLPEGFQRAEFLLEHGMIDRIVARSELKETLGTLIALHQPKKKDKNHE